MLRRIIKLANRLDSLGLTSEADTLDKFVKTSGWMLLDTWQDSLGGGQTPLETMEFRIHYVLNKIFDKDYQFGPGGDMSDMPQYAKDALKRYALSTCSKGTFNVQEFFENIIKLHPTPNADAYTFEKIKNDLKEIVEIQARYQKSISPEAKPAAKLDPASVSKNMSQPSDFTSAPAASTKPVVSKKPHSPSSPAASTKPVVNRKPYSPHSPDALFKAVESLPSDSSLPEGVEGQTFTAPQRTPR
jgi:hypothetical protein